MSFFYDELVTGKSISQLIESELLSTYQYHKLSPAMVTASAAIKDGDYVNTDVAILNDIEILGSSLVESYQKYANGLSCVTVATSIRHSKAIVDSYRLAGIDACHLDQHTSRAEELQTIERFRTGAIEVISCDRLTCASLKLLPIDAIQIAFPTKSLSNYLEMVEWVLQVNKHKERAVIIDHTENWKLHGLPDADRFWTLDTDGDRLDLSTLTWLAGGLNSNSIEEILSRSLDRENTSLHAIGVGQRSR